MPIVYAFVVNDQVIYVGSTRQKLRARMYTHKSEAKTKKRPYYDIINEAGWDGVEIRILFEGEGDQYAIERRMLDQHRDTAKNILNCGVTPEERKERAKASRKRKRQD